MSQKVLVVDDEAHILQVLSIKLRNAGYEIFTAVDGAALVSEAGASSTTLTNFENPMCLAWA